MHDTAGFPELLTSVAGGHAPVSAAAEFAREWGIRHVILVEGVSDRAAIMEVAARQGRTLLAEGIVVVPMGGAMSVGRFARALAGVDVSVVGLCDLGEERFFRRALHDVVVCVTDLEDEFIRSLGTEAVEQVIADEGDLKALRIFQNQPFQRTQSVEQQLHRFFGTIGGRKERFARALAARLDPDALPEPLERVLAAG